MGFLLPSLSRTVAVETDVPVDEARARLDAQTEWLEGPPGMKFERIPYRLIWLLMPDAPQTERAFYGHRGTEGMHISRVPDEFKTSFQPVGTPMFKSVGEGAEVTVRLDAPTRAARFALLTGALALLFGGVAPLLIPGDFPLSWVFTAIGVVVAVLNRVLVAAMFKREVNAFREAMQHALKTPRRP